MGRVVLEKIDKHLGMRIAQARSEAGLSLEAAAAAIDLTDPAYAALEQGDQRVSAFVLANLSRLFGRTIGWFYEGLPGQSAFVGAPKSSSV